MQPRDQAVALWMVSGCTLILAVLELKAPSHPPFTGRWSLLYNWAYTNFGDLGMVIVMVSVAGLLILLGAVVWFKARGSSG